MAPKKPDGFQLNLEFGGGHPTPIDSGARSTLACAQCSTRIEVPDWFMAKKLSVMFCGPKCRRSWASERPDADLGASGVRYSRGGNWKIQSLAARERDNFSCRECGVTEETLGRKLDVHHAIPYASFESNLGANNLEHLASLCPSCHRRAEFHLQEELPLLTRAATQADT